MTRDELYEQAKAMGLNPHHKAGEEKLQAMIDEAKSAPAVKPVPAGYVRLRVRHRGADKINTGVRIEDPLHPYDETHPEGAIIDLPKALADIYIAKDWVDPV